MNSRCLNCGADVDGDVCSSRCGNELAERQDAELREAWIKAGRCGNCGEKPGEGCECSDDDKATKGCRVNTSNYGNRLPYRLPEDAPERKALAEARAALKDADAKLVMADSAAKHAYREEDRRLREQFKADALDELGLTGHPKADQLFDKATEGGGGLDEIWDRMSAMADLVR